jgi:hypothetical protein
VEGPLLDEAGHVIGVVSSKLSDRIADTTGQIPQNVNFAIKTRGVLDLLESREIQYEADDSSTVQQTPAIVETAQKSVAFVECTGSRSAQS